MNNFNKFFLAVKQHCESGEGRIDEILSSISCQVNIPACRLEFYLNTLKTLGLIKYSIQENRVELTSLGTAQNALFS